MRTTITVSKGKTIKPRISINHRAQRAVAARAEAPPAPITPQLPPEAIPISKQATLITQLGAEAGITIQQMMALTGWKAHTVRGTISGVLRKKLGLNVICEKPTASGGRLYRIVSPEVSA